jgi:hypothetical protein
VFSVDPGGSHGDEARRAARNHIGRWEAARWSTAAAQTISRSLILATNGDTLNGALSGIVVTASRQDHASVNSRPYPATGSRTPATRKLCHIIAALLETTGLPRSCSNAAKTEIVGMPVPVRNTASASGASTERARR